MDRKRELADLIRLAQAGDPTALEDLFSQSIDRLRTWLEPRIERRLRSKLDASDVVQSALVEALRGLDSYTYRGPKSFDHWLRRIVERRLFHKRDYWNTEGRDLFREVPLDPQVEGSTVSGAISPPAKGTEPPEKAARAERERILKEEIDRLEAQLRTIMTLSLQGLSHPQIAERLGKSVDQVRRLRISAMEILAIRLRERLGA